MAELVLAPGDDGEVLERGADGREHARRGVDVVELEPVSPAAIGGRLGPQLRRRDRALGPEGRARQRLVEHERAEVEVALHELVAELLALAQRRVLERGHDHERGALVVQERLDGTRALDEAVVHRLEVEEELGDVLEELTAEDAVGHRGRRACSPS